ncbi:MlaD family protein [Comamonas aquatica]|jgi:phospholipid/cholesterol/gamma-HCH transport system substrate-binding protein|uniref:Virulence factor Mce family protein n=1 Tax=Comamonas aquatica TaxID=225991 RepID=A0AA35D8L0_9BURK|nr:MlaD family protein [Comamonas aquatica]CAB5684795.1 virulence factor Mce family protein [Comamonas aquatica]CAB5701041.1 virulence factor Mce family protein [Comamonas aquatica]CAC9183176.1 virulence factor Mce family protein [Comamonas aquatica]CAC9678128.1 virulence factor Mce family protein [Comamonas aquatica]
MENKSHAMAAGSFVLALLVLLGALALWLTRDRHDYTLYEMSTGDTISGLQNHATVRYKGVAVGKVTEITFDQAQQGNVLIRIAVDSKAPVSPTTTFGMLGYQGVTGIAHIQLDDVTEPMAALPEGPGGIPRLLMKSSPLSVLADQGMTILSKVDEATRRINQLLGDDNQERFSSLLLNLSDAASNVSGVTRSMHTTLQQELPGMTQDARRALQAMEKAGQEAGALAQEVRRMTTTVQGPDGALARITEGSQAMARAAERLDRATLPGISQAASDVSSAARRMGSAAAGIGDNPQSLLYGVDAGQPGPGEPGFVAPAAQ